MADLTGRKLGKYELRERLGRGGMADVYKAFQASMDRFVAVKVLHGHLADSSDFIERFKREAQSVGQLRHPHILNVLDFDAEGDLYYMVMEFIQGDTLKSYLEQAKRLPPHEAVRIAGQIADALEYAHERGMVHRDLKPANIMFTEPSRQVAVLTDFGIARILDASGLTMSGMTVGTPAYMSPEAGKGERVDGRADIYSLGVVIYEMLTGEVPFMADTPYAIILKHIQEAVPDLRRFQGNLPTDLEFVVLKTLAKNPAERFQKAAELNAALTEALHDTPTYTLPATPVVTPADETLDTLVGSLDITPASSPTRPQATPTVVHSTPSKPLSPAMIAIGTTLIALLAIVIGFGLLGGDDEDKTTDISEATVSPTTETTASSTDEATVEASPAATEVANLPAAVPLPQAALTCLTQGEQLTTAGDYEAAIEAYTCAVEQAPNSVEPYRGRAFAYSFGANTEAAVADLTTALALSPNNPELLQGRAGLYVSLGNYEAALADYTAALAATTQDDPYLYAARGSVYLLIGNYEAALADYSTAIDADVGEPYFYDGRGDVYTQMGNYIAAQRDYTTAIAMLGENTEPSLYASRASVLLELGNYDAAIADFDQALQAGTGERWMYHGRGIAHYMVGNYDAALADFNQTLALDPDFTDGYVQRGETYNSLGDKHNDPAQYTLAVQDFTRVIEGSAPDEAPVFFSRGYAYLGLQDYALAQADFETAIALDANYAEAYTYLARALTGQQQYEAALTNIATALELGTADWAVYYARAEVYTAQEQFELALADYQQALSIDPNQGWLHWHIGLMHRNLGDCAAAIPEFTAAVSAGVEDPWLYGDRADCYADLQDYPAAIADFEEMIARDPQNSYPYAALGRIYDTLKDYPKALKNFLTYQELVQAQGETADSVIVRRIQALKTLVGG